MKIKTTFSFIGSALAFILATSCCWVPWLLIIAGGATGLSSFGTHIDKYSGLLMITSAVLLAFGYYSWKKNRDRNFEQVKIDYLSTITCPNCSFSKSETMPSNSCVYFYECSSCHTILKPLAYDCCVFCSFANVSCPSIQENAKCC